MQAITALAHLRACVLFFMDLSGQCGYSIEQQLSLFRSIRPLFTGKPLVVVLNKCDVCTIDDLEAAEHDAVMGAIEEAKAKWITTSTLTDIGVGDLKTLACEELLAHRAEEKEGTSRFQGVQNRLFCAVPVARDRVARGHAIPGSVEEAQEAAANGLVREKRETERDREWANGGPGQYQPYFRRTWDLEDPSWVDDIMPEIMDGKNIYDYVDPDIADRLIELEAEEEGRVVRKELDDAKVVPTYSMAESSLDAARFIREKIKVLKMNKSVRNLEVRRTRAQTMSIDRFNARTGMSKEEQDALDAKARHPHKRLRSVSVAESALGRERSQSAHMSTKTTRALSGDAASRERSMSVKRGSGFRDVRQKLLATKLAKVKMAPRARAGRQGEGDHVTVNERPKHLFTGKIDSTGKRDRR
jgi:nucleolar GTP-binding protein